MTRINALQEDVFTDNQSLALKAFLCPQFKLDDEDELVAEEERSCLNCRYRRWTVESFECMKKLG